MERGAFFCERCVERSSLRHALDLQPFHLAVRKPETDFRVLAVAAIEAAGSVLSTEWALPKIIGCWI